MLDGRNIVCEESFGGVICCGSNAMSRNSFTVTTWKVKREAIVTQPRANLGTPEVSWHSLLPCNSTFCSSRSYRERMYQIFKLKTGTQDASSEQTLCLWDRNFETFDDCEWSDMLLVWIWISAGSKIWVPASSGSGVLATMLKLSET